VQLVLQESIGAIGVRHGAARQASPASGLLRPLLGAAFFFPPCQARQRVTGSRSDRPGHLVTARAGNPHQRPRLSQRNGVLAAKVPGGGTARLLNRSPG
jgi:hypothetical protein